MSRGLCAERRVLRSRKLLLSLVGFAIFVLPVVFGFACAGEVSSQAIADNPVKDIDGTWQGTLHSEPNVPLGSTGQRSDLRAVIKILKADDGAYRAIGYSIDQSGDPIPISKIDFDGTTVKISVPFVGAAYEGKLAADGMTIAGNVSQGPNTLSLNLTRAAAGTEWTIPPQSPKPPSTDPTFAPFFEAATIKASKPDQRGKGFAIQGNQITNITLNDLIAFAYGVHPNQTIGMPPWAGTDTFDIEARPGGGGAPGRKQWQGMFQKLMADRFKLAFHRDMREVPVHVLSVGKTGPKLTKGDPNGIPTLNFGILGALHAINATMADFTQMMQARVLDRPVVDQTGLDGRFDFDLNWKPDDSQFAGIKATIPPPADAQPLDIAIQEQIGLKLDAAKALKEVLVIDHVEKPSVN